MRDFIEDADRYFSGAAYGVYDLSEFIPEPEPVEAHNPLTRHDVAWAALIKRGTK